MDRINGAKPGNPQALGIACNVFLHVSGHGRPRGSGVVEVFGARRIRVHVADN